MEQYGNSSIQSTVQLAVAFGRLHDLASQVVAVPRDREDTIRCRGKQLTACKTTLRRSNSTMDSLGSRIRGGSRDRGGRSGSRRLVAAISTNAGAQA
jgi:hypothetical protein